MLAQVRTAFLLNFSGLLSAIFSNLFKDDSKLRAVVLQEGKSVKAIVPPQEQLANKKVKKGDKKAAKKEAEKRKERRASVDFSKPKKGGTRKKSMENF